MSGKEELVLLEPLNNPKDMNMHLLEKICDGTHAYPHKNGIAKTLDKPIVVICSNSHYDDLYPGNDGMLAVRFIEINLDLLTV